MQYTNLTNAELIRTIDNDPHATPLNRELATRLDEVQLEVDMVAASRDLCESKLRHLSVALNNG